MHRILVAYYSRTGYTRTLANELVAIVDADIERLDDGRDRCGVFGYLRSAREAIKRRPVALLAPAFDPSRYDVVVLGTPVWAGNISSPLRSYAADYHEKFARVAFLCTQGGSGAEKVFRDLAQLCCKTPVATLAVSDREIDARAFTARIERFASAIKAAASP